MIAVLLAAGKGSRLSNFTKKPKSFLKLNDKFQIIDYQIKMLEIAGFKNKLFKEKFILKKNIKLIFNKNWKKTNVLGSFLLSINKIKESFIFLHADSLVDKSIYKLFKKRKENKIYLVYKNKNCGDEEMKLYKKQKSIFLSKKKINSSLYGEFTGLAFFPYRYMKEIKKIILILKKKKSFNKFFFEEVINILSLNYFAKFKLINLKKKKFVEVDFKKDYYLAKKLFSNV